MHLLLHWRHDGGMVSAFPGLERQSRGAGAGRYNQIDICSLLWLNNLMARTPGVQISRRMPVSSRPAAVTACDMLSPAPRFRRCGSIPSDFGQTP